MCSGFNSVLCGNRLARKERFTTNSFYSSLFNLNYFNPQHCHWCSINYTTLTKWYEIMKILTPTPQRQHLSILLNFEVKLPTCSIVIIAVQICQYTSCHWDCTRLDAYNSHAETQFSKLWNLNEVKMLSFIISRLDIAVLFYWNTEVWPELSQSTSCFVNFIEVSKS